MTRKTSSHLLDIVNESYVGNLRNQGNLRTSTVMSTANFPLIQTFLGVHTFLYFTIKEENKTINFLHIPTQPCEHMMLQQKRRKEIKGGKKKKKK